MLITFVVGGGNNYVIETAIFNAFYLKYKSDDVYGNHSLATEGTVNRYRKAPNNVTHI